MTDLQRRLAAKDKQGGINFLAGLTDAVEKGNTTIEELEQVLPGPDVTNFWWGQKERFEKCRGQDVVLVMGHCPQYEVTLSTHPEDVSTQQV